MFSLMKFFICFTLLLTAFSATALDVVREKSNQFPRCLKAGGKELNQFYSWSDNRIDRNVFVAFSSEDCNQYPAVLKSETTSWITLKQAEGLIPVAILHQLKQIEQKATELRREFSAKDYLKTHPLTEYTFATNRELSQKYGQMFSAMVFKAWIEQNPENLTFKNEVLEDMKTHKNPLNHPFAHFSDKVKLVVSFGLGWEEKYGRTTPDYILNFLSDIKSLGLPVHFLKKNPFGRVADNVEKIIPSLEAELNSGKDLILISLCKGTPELLAAEAELARKGMKGRILGHVNLSGMLSGAVFSDYAKEIVLPKVVAPLLKKIPFDSVRDSARMVDALEYMKSSVIADTLSKAEPHMDKDIFYINITGAPMSNEVFKGNSPMRPILNYNQKMAFVNSANDGFLEMPGTLIPQTFSKNQVSLILDSSHLLADGSIDGLKIDSSSSRRVLYYSVIKKILNKSADN